jgi:uncharacterized protein (DUF305 family)
VPLVVVVVCGSCLALSERAAGVDHTAEMTYAGRVAFTRYATGATTDYTALPVTSEADALVAMIEHHRDAIASAQDFLASHLADPFQVSFAEAIVRVQTAQIDQMEAWLDEWHPGVRHSGFWIPMCTIGPASPHDFFATMIEHHRAAVQMYVQWITDGAVEHTELGLLAVRIAKGQTGEIAVMERMLASLG